MLPRTVEYILGDHNRLHPLSLGSRVCRPIDRNALNIAFRKIDCRTIKSIMQFCDWFGNPLCLDFQRSLFRSFSDSLKEKVHLSTCHFRLIKNRRRLESSLAFSRLLKIEKAKLCQSVIKIYLIRNKIFSFFILS